MGEENVGKILSAPPKVSSYVVFTIYHNTDYGNKGQSSLLKRKKTCRLNVVNFDTLNLKSRLLIIIFVISNKNLNC